MDRTREYLSGLSEIASGRWGAPRQIASHLIADALEWRAAQQGERTPPPGLVATLRGATFPRGLEPLLAAQRELHGTARSDAWADYVPNLMRFVAARTRGSAEHVSSASTTDTIVAALLARLPAGADSTPRVLTLYDPVIGTGSLAVAAARQVTALGYGCRVLGQDIDSGAAAVASAALWLSGIEADVRPADVLATDAFSEEVFDLAVAEPPFGLPWQHNQRAVREAAPTRFPAGLPSGNDSTLLFVQTLISKMRPAADGGARAVVLCASGSMTSRSGDAIRTWLLEQDLIEAIVSLPEGLSATTDVHLTALVLSNAKGQQRVGTVQLVDLRGSYQKQDGQALGRRRLTEEAVATLATILRTTRDGFISRTVGADDLRMRDVVFASRTDVAGPPSRRTARLPFSADPVLWAQRECGATASEVREVATATSCELTVDRVLNRQRQELTAWLRARRWPATRLAALAASVVQVPSSRTPGDRLASDRKRSLARVGGAPRIILTVNAHEPVRFDDPQVAAPAGRFIAVELLDAQQGEFLTAWLNSEAGRTSREAAATNAFGADRVRSSTVRAADALVSELIVPLPAPGVQRELLAASDAIAMAAQRAARAEQELWRSPENMKGALRQLSPERTVSLQEWSASLPYPLASALWTYEAQKASAYAANKQLFLFWEATAAFIATFLLSALSQDEVLQEEELAATETVLAGQRLSMERATFGSWLVIVQRLSKTFRGMQDAEEGDEQARLAYLFAHAPEELIRAVISTDLMKLLVDVNAKRNTWSGHTGATSPAAIDEQNTYLQSRISVLREILSDSFKQFPLVRAGQMAHRDGVFSHDVELVMGTSTPFIGSTIALGAAMNHSELYFAAEGAPRALPVPPFIQLRHGPQDLQYACYFYNRRDGDESRLVSYHLGSASEVHEQSPAISQLLGRFAGATLESKESGEGSLQHGFLPPGEAGHRPTR